MIHPGGLLLVVTKYAVPVTVLLVGLPKENSLTSTFNFIIQSDKLSWSGDAHRFRTLNCCY
jgi:hypothetical protein